MKLHIVYERDLDLIRHEAQQKRHQEELEYQKSMAHPEQQFPGRPRILPIEQPKPVPTMTNIDVDPIDNRPSELLEIDILKYCLNDWSEITKGRPKTKDWKKEMGSIFVKEIL